MNAETHSFMVSVWVRGSRDPLLTLSVQQATALVDFPTREDYDRLKAVFGDALIFVGDPSDLAADYIAGTVLVCLSKEMK